MLKDFKAFAFKGHLIEMTVGIIIGGAFTTSRLDYSKCGFQKSRDLLAKQNS